MEESRCSCKQNGCIRLILGPMFSGKTTEMFRLCTRQKLAGKNVTIVKYAGDVRYDENMASTHDCKKMEAIAAKEIKEVFHDLEEADVIGIDEGQFFPDIVECAEQLANLGKIVFIAGLDGDFRREPFPCIARLLAFAENAYKLTAVCKRCGQAAPFTHRKIETNQIEVIGGEETYMAVCRDCYRDLNKTRFPNINEANGSPLMKTSEARISLSGIENCEPLQKRPRMLA
ncbi:hypothetical protein FO519_006091 [Halicephalobus sp. NKZ332]|nr:hypothetical protein FO519_006091 [Halicephalobus sp. NKZ332]